MQTKIEKIGNTPQRKRKYTESQGVATNVAQESNMFVIGNRAPCKKGDWNMCERVVQIVDYEDVLEEILDANKSMCFR